jgi:hypothetical protein
MLEIKFDAGSLSAEEAAALVAFLTTIHPSAAEHATRAHGKSLHTGAALAALTGATEGACFVASGSLGAAVEFPGTDEGSHFTVQRFHEDDRPAEPAPVTDPAVAFAPLAAPAVASAAAPAAPPPPSPASVATQSPSVNPAGVALDVTGIPHDARIHSTPAKKNQDGTWRQKRGVAADLVAAVTAELRAAQGAPAPAAAAAAAPPPPPVAAPAPLPPAAIEAAQAAALAEAATASVALSPAQVFAGLMKKVAPAQAAGKLTTDEINAILSPHGLTSLSQLLTRSDIVAVVEPQFDALIASKG